VRNFLASLVGTAAALGLGAWLLDGVELEGVVPALLAALVLGLINALVRPVLVLLTLPITLVTLGLFLFVINALLLMLTAWLAPDFAIRGFWSALVLALIVTVVNAVLGSLLAEKR
jgi:putative membrane protein